MKLTKAEEKAAHVPVEGFDGGLYEHEGRRVSVLSTHGWVLVSKGKAQPPIVVFQTQEPDEGEPHSYVMDRAEFLKSFRKVELPPAT